MKSNFRFLHSTWCLGLSITFWQLFEIWATSWSSRNKDTFQKWRLLLLLKLHMNLEIHLVE